MTKYYTGKSGKQVFDFIEEFELGFNLGNVAKYICRCRKKGNIDNSIQDLEKAKAYLDREICLLLDERQMQNSCNFSNLNDLKGLAKRESL